MAIAIAPYQTTEAGHLSFEQNEIIHVTRQVDENWYEGEIRVSELCSSSFAPFWSRAFAVVRSADAHRPIPRQLRADTNGSIAYRLCKCIGYITGRQPVEQCVHAFASLF